MNTNTIIKPIIKPTVKPGNNDAVERWMKRLRTINMFMEKSVIVAKKRNNIYSTAHPTEKMDSIQQMIDLLKIMRTESLFLDEDYYFTILKYLAYQTHEICISFQNNRGQRLSVQQRSQLNRHISYLATFIHFPTSRTGGEVIDLTQEG